MIAQVPLRLAARTRCSANAMKAARSAGDGEEASARSEKLVKAGIQDTAGLNSEGIEGFPLSFSLRCPCTLLTEGSHLGSGASLDSASRAHVGHCGVRGDNVDRTVCAAIRTLKDYFRAFLGAKHVIGHFRGAVYTSLPCQ